MDKQHLLVINSGSSSIKFALYEISHALNKIIFGAVENINLDPVLKLFDHTGQIIKEENFAKECEYSYFFELLLSSLKSHQDTYNLIAAGHRVVHGGNDFHAPILVTPCVIKRLQQFSSFAPLHQPYNLAAMEAIANFDPSLPQIACFDTAFHRSHPVIADTFALPRALQEEGIKRYGFHGLSYEYIMHQLEARDITKRFDRLIIAHLGNGASMCAVKEGKSIDSTMGFTALDGLMMGTRCGSIDPGVLLYLLEAKHMTVTALENLLYKQSGLLGVSGISSNVKELLETENPVAAEAVHLFVYRARKELGALTAVLGGLDMLVFTGGIGEHAWQIREAICSHFEWLGVQLNKEHNRNNRAKISSDNSAVDIYIIPTDEEWIIANHCQKLLKNEEIEHG